MSARLLLVEDSELEKVSGGLIIEKNCNGSVDRVIASKEEYRYIMDMGYSKNRGLTAEDVYMVKLQLSRFGFRVRSQMKLTPRKFLPEEECVTSLAELIVID